MPDNRAYVNPTVDFARIGRFRTAQAKPHPAGARVWSLCGGDFRSEQ